ncbi:MAG: hypothetical protein KME15_17450 [Drouetiella hepatica Uher 2000/2452]|uniref:Uncharacterized protein n=1 Tax=Drouetiella hepatica Uher 2000/2452 TaxID=904376 RepID=A0A951QCY3_9CYAN|nr:hypothetical protein [Drouetiella hepatica Uher 2000/2452]
MRQVSRQVSWIALTMGLALVATGCGGDGSTTATSPTTTASSPVPVASPTIAASPSPGQPGNPAFTNPTVSPQNVAPRGILPPDLISSTDPNQRVRQVQSSRSDPFALLPTSPTVRLPPPLPTVAVAPPSGAAANPFPTVRQTSPNRTTSSGGSGGSSAVSRQSGGSSGSGALAPIPTLVPRATPILPPAPQPDLARAVMVTGVVQVGETLYAIVNAPNEPSSRYVQAGQRLSNGQILVRRIDANGAEPQVVFEQFGIEVVRAVGEGGAPTSSTPAASVPTAATRG